MTSEYEWFSIKITKMWSYAGIVAAGGEVGLGEGDDGEGPEEGLCTGLGVGDDDCEGDADTERCGLGDGELVALPGMSDGDEVGWSVEFCDGDVLTAATATGDVVTRECDVDEQAQLNKPIPISAAIELRTPGPSTARRLVQSWSLRPRRHSTRFAT